MGRMEKVNSLLKHEISKIISEDLRDRDLTGLITVTKVDTSPDFSIAKVYISMIASKNDKANLRALKKASGFVRASLARKINLKKTPEIIFLFDESIEYGIKMDKLLDEVAKELEISEEKRALKENSEDKK